jgi:hypothetical protein
MTLPDGAGEVASTGGAVMVLVVTCGVPGGYGAVPVHPHKRRMPITAKITLRGIKGFICLMLHGQVKKVLKNTSTVPEPQDDWKFFFIVPSGNCQDI